MNKSFSKTLLISSACLSTSVGSFNLYADGAEQSNNLDEIIITANRYSQAVNESLSSVSVITRDDIENSTAQDLPTLLSTVAGFDMRASGAYGKTTSFFMRGTNSSHLLTLVDGVKLYSATAGNTSLQHISLDQIERVEIVRGPRSSVYGSEAIGGVIQIFTRKGKNKSSASANVGLGSNSSKELSASFSGASEKARFNLTASSFKTDGIDAIIHTTPNDKDGYNNDSISTNLNYQFSPQLSLQSSFMNAQGSTQYDECVNTTTFVTSDDCSSNFVQQTFNNTFSLAPQGLWDAKLELGTSKDLNENFWEAAENGSFQTKRDSATFINNLQLSENQLLVLGIDYAKDSVETMAYPPTAASSRNNTGVFASWNSRIYEYDIELNARRDDNQQFNTYNTGSIAVGHAIASNMQVFASYGTAFKAPTFNELYFPFFGSETLKPEESSSAEIGLRGDYHSGNWSFNIYQTNIDNLIAYDPGLFLANNIDKSQITGAELISNNVFYKWHINTSISYTDPVNKSGPDKGKQLIARARETISITANRNLGSYNFGMAFLAQSKRYTSTDNSASTAGYGLVDLSMGYNFNPQFKLTMKLNNIFDKEYVLNQAYGGSNYNTLDRNVFINLVYTM